MAQPSILVLEDDEIIRALMVDVLEVRVLTSIKPLQLIAAAVQDGVAIPEVLLPPGASPHNYALRPSDVRRVQSVDLLY